MSQNLMIMDFIDVIYNNRKLNQKLYEMAFNVS